jgi:transposase
LQRGWAVWHHGRTNAYSEDLRKKRIVEAVEGGMPMAEEAARAFGAGISSLERFVATHREGRRSLAPKEASRLQAPKLDASAKRSCWKRTSQSALRPRSAPEARVLATGARGGVEVSDDSTTVSRMLGRLGWSRKKDRWERRQNATSS